MCIYVRCIAYNALHYYKYCYNSVMQITVQIFDIDILDKFIIAFIGEILGEKFGRQNLERITGHP